MMSETDNWCDYTIRVQTGDRPGAGTDANVFIILHGEGGLMSPKTKLDCSFRDDFERGQTDTFKIKAKKTLSVKYIEVWRDSTGIFNKKWFIDTIWLTNDATQEQQAFPVFRWIRANHRYNFIPLDTSLPQYDQRKEQRQTELGDKKRIYQLESKAPGLPPQAKCLPSDEQFSFDIKWDLNKQKTRMLLTSKFKQILSGRWKSIDDIKKIYTTKDFTAPDDLDRWQSDLAFGRQRITGVNCTQLHLCRLVPQKLGVTAEMLQPMLEGMSLEEALANKRLFIVDYECLVDIPHSNDVVCCAPIALFFCNGKGKLLPLAIQLYQDKGPYNPVFLPTDPKYTWILAKMWFNNADSAVHQALTHLCYTHLMMEGIAVITHRNLSLSHPIFKLLAPHFLYLLAINSRALNKLLTSGGWVDTTMSVAVKGLLELARRGQTKWRMDVEGTLPEDLKVRGLDDSNIIPEYHYREDALLLYFAIKRYVSKYVCLYYDAAIKLLEDHELQTWGEEMVTPIDEGGCGIKGVPGNGHFAIQNQLIVTLSSIIYTCSVGHAAANFKQYDEYAFPPNYPSKLYGNPPTNKNPVSENDILAVLPDISTTYSVMTITKILSQRSTKALGDFEVQYIFDPAALTILEEFRTEMKQIEETISSRNKTRNPAYSNLYPSQIPNAISI